MIFDLQCRPYCKNVDKRNRKIAIILIFNPFPNDKFYSSKPKEFAYDNFKFDENGRKFSRQVENTVGNREIARYEQFLLFPQCFQNTCAADT